VGHPPMIEFAVILAINWVIWTAWGLVLERIARR
jgi:hypothetical protein